MTDLRTSELRTSEQPDTTTGDDAPSNKSGDFDTLVLSGGSIQGIITLGALQYCTDNYLMKKIDTFIGTSAGAIICYLLAIGYDPIEIMVYLCTKQIMERMKHFNVVAMINGGGATTFSHVHEQLEKMTIEKIGRLITLKDLYTNFGKTLMCMTHNFSIGNQEIISHETYPDIPCLTALRMSSNLPFIFDNFKYMGNYYVDGAFSNNFPINIGDEKGNKILGIVLQDIHKKSSNDSILQNDSNGNIIEYIYQLLSIPVLQIVEEQIKNVSNKCTIVSLKPDNTLFFNFNIDTHSKLEMFSNGYIQMKTFCEKIN